MALLLAAQEHILAQENGKDRGVRAVRELSQVFALAVPHQEGLRIRDDVALFQAVHAVLAKRAPGEAQPEEELDHAGGQIISRAVAPQGAVDILAVASLAKPGLSILSDEFLAEVRGMPHKNLAVELLQKLLKGEINSRRRNNFVQAHTFAVMLEQTIRRYQNRAIEAAQVIEELIALARDMQQANARGDMLNLSEEQLAFYNTLETNDSAVKVPGDETLQTIARELVATVRNNVSIDGRCATTCRRISACWSSASCASTAIRRTSGRRRRRRRWNKPRCFRRNRLRHEMPASAASSSASSGSHDSSLPSMRTTPANIPAPRRWTPTQGARCETSTAASGRRSSSDLPAAGRTSSRTCRSCASPSVRRRWTLRPWTTPRLPWRASPKFIRKVGSDGFRIGHQPTTKKVVSDRRASPDEETETKPTIRKLVEDGFRRGASIPVVPFPRDSIEVPDSTRLTLVIVEPEDEGTPACTAEVAACRGAESLRSQIAKWTRRRGTFPRLYPGAFVWCLKRPGRTWARR